jgi:hypothetical protein
MHDSPARSMVLWLVLLAFSATLLTACSSRRREAPVRAYNPCGELQAHMLELQQIEDDLHSPELNMDKQKELQERKQYLHRQDERLKQDCGG